MKQITYINYLSSLLDVDKCTYIHEKQKIDYDDEYVFLSDNILNFLFYLKYIEQYIISHVIHYNSVSFFVKKDCLQTFIQKVTEAFILC